MPEFSATATASASTMVSGMPTTTKYSVLSGRAQEPVVRQQPV